MKTLATMLPDARLHRPMLAVLSLRTDDVGGLAGFARTVVDLSDDEREAVRAWITRRIQRAHAGEADDWTVAADGSRLAVYRGHR